MLGSKLFGEPASFILSMLPVGRGRPNRRASRSFGYEWSGWVNVGCLPKLIRRVIWPLETEVFRIEYQAPSVRDAFTQVQLDFAVGIVRPWANSDPQTSSSLDRQ